MHNVDLNSRMTADCGGDGDAGNVPTAFHVWQAPFELSRSAALHWRLISIDLERSGSHGSLDISTFVCILPTRFQRIEDVECLQDKSCLTKHLAHESIVAKELH